MDSPADSQRSLSPLSRVPESKAKAKALDARDYPQSPLRQGRALDGFVDEPAGSNGSAAPLALLQSPLQSPNGTDRADEFPFDAPPGAAREIPTNDLALRYKGDGTVDLRKSSIGTAEADDIPTDLVAAPKEGGIQRKTSEPEAGTPTGRRSVQFARESTRESTRDSQPGHSQKPSEEQNDLESPTREVQTSGQRLTSKLRALATQIGHSRSMSAWTIGTPHADGQGSPSAQTQSPPSEGPEPAYGMEDSEADADAEESGAEGVEGAGGIRRPPRPRRKSRRIEGGIQTAPTTPRNIKIPSWMRDGSPSNPTTPSSSRPGFMRRATMTDVPESQRVGVSEDEGRDRLARGFRRTMTGVRGASYSGSRRPVDASGRSGQKPSNLRRITGLVGGNQEGGFALTARQRGSDSRQTAFGAQRWQQLKAGLKTFMRQEKLRIDHAKSAELMAELMAGAPAALILASMFQRDEEKHKRIPVLLEQLKVRIAENRKVGERHHIFKVELEYGNGLTRMKWVIYRTVGEFINLNTAYARKDLNKRLLFRGDGRAKKPHFPWDVFPYLRSARGLLGAESDEEEDEVERGAEPNGAESEPEPQQRPGHMKKRQSSMAWLRSRGTNDPQAGGSRNRLGSTAGLTHEERERNYSEMQRKSLENYLQKMITSFMFRPDSNRLCKFLELSALGIRLGAEGGYHGKEGTLLIKSSKGRDFRRQWKPRLIKERHEPKWFIVRHSYIICVDSPEEMNIYDVILLDPEFSLQKKTSQRQDDDTVQDLTKRNAKKAATKAAHPKFHHQLEISNTERSIKLLGRTKETINQFEQSISFIRDSSPWGQVHRFGSFAPLRKGVFARWLVDGRDYMWQVSKAISRATDVIYIHDWWLSPELYLRRPPAISQKWRLDRLLQRKAREGVKIFVIMYRNINTAIPIDSEYSKFSLLDLHPNVFVQRSPNQFRQNTFFWSHHEKICIVDHNIAFCGGVDLCFGRWDTPEHTLVDDKMTGFELSNEPKDADHVQLWPGKDYSNPRVQDFYALDKPYEEMYDRSKIPRMPWHDIGMQIVGQPARDLTRHFVQRWNFILRQRNPSRPTPFLLPPPDFSREDLAALDMDGTCEIQMLRSSCEWSLGIKTPEHSIMNAYVKTIEQSEHFVYMENQFFITSCTVQGTRVENLIGDALVDRIIRAHNEGTDWRAVIVIPLMPGYESTVDSQEGSSVRLIMTCQYRSICRGSTSIFERLRAHGIEPSEYIEFYSLRQWGKIGLKKVMVTEQLYIHAKVMVVDDRVAIIGSANINERSLLGTRDSEVAAVVRDTDMIDSHMAGEPFKVGRFPHTLRMRLMREHLGIDVDAVAEEDRLAEETDRFAREVLNDDNCYQSPRWSPGSPLRDNATELQLIESHHRLQDDLISKAEKLHSLNRATLELVRQKGRKKLMMPSPKVTHNPTQEAGVSCAGVNNRLGMEARDRASGSEKRLTNGLEYPVDGAVPDRSHYQNAERSKSALALDNRPSSAKSASDDAPLPPPPLSRAETARLGFPALSSLPELPALDDTDIGAPPLQRNISHLCNEIIASLIAEMRRPVVHRDCMRDPLTDTFFYDTWHTVAENNTKIFRNVFRCQPDSEVKTWREYREYAAFGERFSMRQGGGKSTTQVQHDAPGSSSAAGQGPARSLEKVGGLFGKVIPGVGGSNHPLGKVEEWTADQEKHAEASASADGSRTPTPEQNGGFDEKTGEFKNGSPSKKAADAVPNNNKSTSNAPPTAGQDSAPPDGVNGEKRDVPLPTDGEKAAEGPERERGDSAAAVLQRDRGLTISEASQAGSQSAQGSQRRKQRRRGTTNRSMRTFVANSDDAMLEPAQAEELLEMVQGTLVVFPYDWLEREEHHGNWLYTVDQLAPLEIYT